MKSKVKVHDGIVGMIYMLSVILALTVNIQWVYLAGAVAALQIISMFTGFCPVYFVLDKVMGEEQPPAPEPNTF
ncbi:MAG: DUF2892 domain-containing protein [Balneolaceae bacterium]|nr:DUF2892 domain-containing protein [Balneolaceae bacterium]